MNLWTYFHQRWILDLWFLKHYWWVLLFAVIVFWLTTLAVKTTKPVILPTHDEEEDADEPDDRYTRSPFD